MLKEMIEKGYGNEEGLNCAEKILYGANEVYNLGLSRECLKLSAGFGGGMQIKSVCGALTGGVMVISKIFSHNDSYNKEQLKDLIQEFFRLFEEKMGSIRCNALKPLYRTEEKGCQDVISEAADILCFIIDKELKVCNQIEK